MVEGGNVIDGGWEEMLRGAAEGGSSGARRVIRLNWLSRGSGNCSTFAHQRSITAGTIDGKGRRVCVITGIQEGLYFRGSGSGGRPFFY